MRYLCNRIAIITQLKNAYEFRLCRLNQLDRLQKVWYPSEQNADEQIAVYVLWYVFGRKWRKSAV